MIVSVDQNQYDWTEKSAEEEGGAVKPLNRNDQYEEGIIVSRVQNSEMSRSGLEVCEEAFGC